MVDDIIGQGGHLFLGSRLKRLGERMQADVMRMVEAEGLPIQPSQAPLLAALDRYGPLTVGAMVEAMGLSQPAVTRSVARLVELGLVEIGRSSRDQRQRTITLTPAGATVRRTSRRVSGRGSRARSPACVPACRGRSSTSWPRSRPGWRRGRSTSALRRHRRA